VLLLGQWWGEEVGIRSGGGLVGGMLLVVARGECRVILGGCVCRV